MASKYIAFSTSSLGLNSGAHFQMSCGVLSLERQHWFRQMANHNVFQGELQWTIRLRCLATTPASFWPTPAHIGLLLHLFLRLLSIDKKNPLGCYLSLLIHLIILKATYLQLPAVYFLTLISYMCMKSKNMSNKIIKQELSKMKKERSKQNMHSCSSFINIHSLCKRIMDKCSS